MESDQALGEEEKDALNENISQLVERKFSHREKVARALLCPITKVPFSNADPYA